MKLSRRQLLQYGALLPGSAAVSPLLWPWLKHVQAEAQGALPPQRFVFVCKSSGLTPAELVPEQLFADRVSVGEANDSGPNYRQPWSMNPTATLIDRPLADLTLPVSLAALKPLQHRTTIVQGLSGKMCRGGHSSWFGAMGCYRSGGEHDWGNIIGPTFDGLMARQSPGIFPHVGLSIGGKVMGGPSLHDGVVYPGISAIARNRQLPYQATPLAAYKELFSVAATSEADLMENRLNGTLLDFMVKDIRRLESRIGGAEKEKLEVYLDGFESLRLRQRQLQGVEAQVRRHAPVVSDKYTSSTETDRIEAHFDIAAASLIAGLTNVITLRPDTLSVQYTGLGVDKNVHGLGHGEGEDPNGHRRRIRTLQVEQIARLAARLQATPEGAGTMLDNTLIVYFSDAGEKHHASSSEWPFVLVGGLGSRFQATGRYLQYPSYQQPGHRTIANLYMTLGHAVGLQQETFGQLDANLDAASQQGPLRELISS
ncbi:DUF1552 domain-containing protein [Lignipirellula cremea]|uniref:DUF1552 domain-containing protein n=1 Tax=Lignipirellula cremea TaxID=2528010 RepID=A0A518DM57_9BACT|nr:DUF1552 domain-containing protein [Lignipirellula cremea]QDU92928.1 hypothetical protein Pla8534_07010 [Lignipirellula cremea]